MAGLLQLTCGARMRGAAHPSGWQVWITSRYLLESSQCVQARELGEQWHTNRICVRFRLNESQGKKLQSNSWQALSKDPQ